MSDRDSQLMAILRIGHDTSMRGAGISLDAALLKTRYSALRATIEPTDLVPLIQADETLCEEWLAYSQDKRTSGGWYLLEDYSVGRLNPKAEVAPERYQSREEGVANFVLRELDFWANVNDG